MKRTGIWTSLDDEKMLCIPKSGCIWYPVLEELVREARLFFFFFKVNLGDCHGEPNDTRIFKKREGQTEMRPDR